MKEKLCYHRNKKTGVTYVYRIEKNYWDKEKKAPRNKQVCIGKLDPKTGEIVPTKRKKKIVERAAVIPGVTVTSRVAGPFLILDKITEQHGLNTLLKKCWPNSWKFIQSLVYFIAHKGIALSRVEPWSSAVLHPFKEQISSQRVSDLLKSITEDDRQLFLSHWLRHISENDYLCYDIPSVSSYAKHNEYIRFGYNRDNESLEQINLAMLFGQKSNLPGYYRRLPGNITDVATLKTTLKSLKFLGSKKMHLVLDRGFYSNANIDELYKSHHKFTIALPKQRKWIRELLDKYIESIASPSNYLTMNKGEALFCTTELYKWGPNNHRAYVHIYYNAEMAAENFDRFTRKLLEYREEVISGNRVKAHEENYKRYLTIKETPKRGLKVTFNEEAIQRNRNRYAGFFCIMSNKIKDTEEALRVYRAKDMVENNFDDLKNHLDMKRLRVHTAAAMDSRLFLQFLALVYLTSIREKIKEDKILKHLTAREVLEEIETLTKITYSNRYGKIYTETTPLEKRIMEVFGIVPPA